MWFTWEIVFMKEPRKIENCHIVLDAMIIINIAKHFEISQYPKRGNPSCYSWIVSEIIMRVTITKGMRLI